MDVIYYDPWPKHNCGISNYYNYYFNLLPDHVTFIFIIIPLQLVTSLQLDLNCFHFSLQWLNTYLKKQRLHTLHVDKDKSDWWKLICLTCLSLMQTTGFASELQRRADILLFNCSICTNLGIHVKIFFVTHFLCYWTCIL